MIRLHPSRSTGPQPYRPASEQIPSPPSLDSMELHQEGSTEEVFKPDWAPVPESRCFTELQRAHLRTQQRLKEQSDRFSLPIADKGARFPEELRGRFRGERLGILGDGEWYHGWMSVEYRLDQLADSGGKNRYLFDPKYLDQSGRVDERAVRASGRDPETIGEVVPSLEHFPPGTRSFILSPNRFHVGSLKQLCRHANAASIYVEKPVAINLEQLDSLERVMRANSKPVFFADHYLYKATGLMKLLGKNVIHGEALELRSDPTGLLGRALRGEEPLLGPLSSVEGVTTFLGSDDLLEGRGWLEKASLGGGVLLDLMVHQLNVLHALGLEMEQICETRRLVRPDMPDTPRGTFIPIDSDSDLAEDFAFVKGRLRGGAQVSLKAAQFETAHTSILTLTDIKGRTAQLDFSTRTVRVFENGRQIGEVRCEADPVLLMMDHALNYFASQDSEPMFYEEQKASIEIIERIKKRDRAFSLSPDDLLA